MRKESTKDGYTKKQIACAEIEAIEPQITQEELAERIGVNKKTIYNWHHDDRYMELYHLACERHFRSLESLAIKTLNDACKKGNVIAAQYLLNYKGYKPAEDINLSTGEINIKIDD